MLIRSHRGGRLPLPSSVRQLDDSDDPALARVHRFTDALCELSAVEWLALGRRLLGDEVGTAARRAAWATLDRVLSEERLGVAAWYVRDAVETAAFLAMRRATCLSRAERRQLLAAQAAAEEAALALLAGEHLPRATYEMLSGPLTRIVPPDLRGSV